MNTPQYLKGSEGIVLGNGQVTANTIWLRDGRRLSYAEFGDPTGKPLFHFHGYPGSRLEGVLANLAAAKNHIRLIAIDRPGMGLSDFKPKRSILDWPDDVIELTDSLRIDRFAVEGVSGGGPYSAACAYKISGRLTSVSIVGGEAPFGIQVRLGVDLTMCQP